MRMSSSQFQREAVTSMLAQQHKLSRTQQKLSSGRGILTPADDPAGAARALDLTKAQATLKQYSKNAEQAQLRLSIEETILDQVGNLLQRVRELAIQGNNATNDSENRRQIASEMEQRFEQLVQLANSSDGKGEYLFSGSRTRTEPFVQVAGEVAFQGDQMQRTVQVGPSRRLAVDHSGFDVFMSIPNGNGTFVIAEQAGGNDGRAVIDTPGVIVDATAYQPVAHTVTFREHNDEMRYMVTDADGNAVEPPPPADPADPAGWLPYEPKQAIVFNGIAVTFDGEPAEGDAFDVTPSSKQSMFVTLQQLISALSEGDDSPAERASTNNAVSRALSEIDLAMENIFRVRAEVGGRLNSIDSEMESNGAAELDVTQALSRIEDLDYAEAISVLSQQLVGLQASQQSYSKIQGLSLFNYI